MEEQSSRNQRRAASSSMMEAVRQMNQAGQNMVTDFVTAFRSQQMQPNMPRRSAGKRGGRGKRSDMLRTQITCVLPETRSALSLDCKALQAQGLGIARNEAHSTGRRGNSFLPLSWSSDRLKTHVLGLYPRVLNFNYGYATKPLGYKITPIPSHIRSPADIKAFQKGNMGKSRLYIIPTDLLDAYQQNPLPSGGISDESTDSDLMVAAHTVSSTATITSPCTTGITASATITDPSMETITATITSPCTTVITASATITDPSMETITSISTDTDTPTIVFHPRVRRNRLSLHQSHAEPGASTYRSYVGLWEPVTVSSDSEDDCQEDIQDLTSFPNLVEILVQLQSKLSDERITKLNITRTNVLDGARRSIHRKTFSAENKLSVRFTDTFGTNEGAIDEGGPKREFLRMLVFQVQQLPLFEGPDNARVLSCNAGALNDELFKDVGVFIALSICHGGPAPTFFSDVIYNYLVYGLSRARQGLEISHIADEELRMQVTRIQMAQNLEDLNGTMDNMGALLIAAGCYRYISDINQKEKLVEDFTAFLVLGRTSTALHQLAEGLETLDVLGTCRKYPEVMRALFVPEVEGKMTADIIEVIFNKIDYSCEGSNARLKEEKVIGFWRDFIMDIDEEEDKVIQLTDILVFATGADRAPPLGFNPEPCINSQQTLPFQQLIHVLWNCICQLLSHTRFLAHLSQRLKGPSALSAVQIKFALANLSQN